MPLPYKHHRPANLCIAEAWLFPAASKIDVGTSAELRPVP
jgi:hypothetical protein